LADVLAHKADIAAGYQAAIVRQLVDKAVRCAEAEGLQTVAVAGGVAANSGLRTALAQECERRGLRSHLPPLALCTDNAAMIGLASAYLPSVPWPHYLSLDAYAAAAATSAAARLPKQRRAP
jgi:N6-L-threonylcarbamoyladenine synthase